MSHTQHPQRGVPFRVVLVSHSHRDSQNTPRIVEALSFFYFQVPLCSKLGITVYTRALLLSSGNCASLKDCCNHTVSSDKVPFSTVSVCQVDKEEETHSTSAKSDFAFCNGISAQTCRNICSPEIV